MASKDDSKLTEDEINLIQRVKKGDKEAFSQLQKQYGPYVFKLIRKSGINTDDAEDITQDAFIRVFNSIEQFRFQGAFRGWLRRIVVHLKCDWYTQRAREQVILTQDGKIPERPTTPESGPADIVERKAQQQWILKRVRELLTSEDFTILVAHVQLGHSYEEIADTLNMTEGNVRVRMYRIRRRLSVLLSESAMSETVAG